MPDLENLGRKKTTKRREKNKGGKKKKACVKVGGTKRCLFEEQEG